MTTIWWIRRDFRLSDNPGLVAACEQGAVIPLFIREASVDGLGMAPKWRLGLGLAHLMNRIKDRGGRVILRSGDPMQLVPDLISETGATGVVWNRLYDPDLCALDTALKTTLKARGLWVQSYNSHLLFEPWTVATGAGTPYKVYTPYWNTVKHRDVPTPLPPPKMSWPHRWPESETLKTWQLGQAMQRGAKVVHRHCGIGEDVALDRLVQFIDTGLENYETDRDIPSKPATSRLSENLAYGEISARQIWFAARAALARNRPGAEKFLKELVWREFAYHLYFHGEISEHHMHRADWTRFDWRADNEDAERWRRGMTGAPFVDAGMREMYATGTMHNRARMIVASYLTKHLMTDWRVGLAWFADCLIDWDPASNAMGWQWVAGCGPDAAPYFRIFNPAGQADKFDGKAIYQSRWIAEGAVRPTETALSYFDAIPRSWGLSAKDAYPAPLIDLKTGRERALSAYHAFKG